jgi:YD repeat-containing protein
MTTYTYDPLIGVTSQCDVGSRVTYYEYDGLQRLLRIRDMDGNIVKQFEYQYQASTGCGSNCYVLSMTNFAGTNTLSYPVGVFNANGKLLDTATNQARFIAKWNADTANANRGTLSAGGDSMHFQLTLNAGKALPAITGCRFYKVDISWNQFDGVRNINGCYVDFGDGASVRLPPNPGDVINPLPANTIQIGSSALYLVHTYADASLKTLTFYHNDAEETQYLDNANSPATSVSKLTNFRGNLPQHIKQFGSSSYQQASMSSVANVINWASIHSINDFHLNTGDGGTTTIQNLSYQQDFMAGNPDLQSIQLARNNVACYFDSTFKISRIKSDWNTWFKHLQFLSITNAQWNREDLSALKELNYFYIIPARPLYSNNPTNNAEIPIPQSVVDGIFNQIAAGSGQTVNGGFLYISSGGSGRSASSNAAVSTLLAKGWALYLDGQQLQ